MLSPIDVDCDVFSPTIQLGGGGGPPTVLSPIDVDSAVEQLATSVRRISEEQDALFNIFRSGHITGGGQNRKRSRSMGNYRKDEEDKYQVGAEKGKSEKTDKNQGQPNVAENLELVKSKGNAARESDEHVKDTTNLKHEEETHLPKESVKPKSEDKSEKKQKGKEEKKTKKRRPSLFVEIPSVEPDSLKTENNAGGREHAAKEESWSVSIPIIRTDRQDGVTNPVKVSESDDNPMKRRESNDKTSINIPILRSFEPEEKVKLFKKSRVVVGSKESGRCTNDDGGGHNCFPPATNEDALVSEEMRTVISKLKRVKGELEKKGVEERANGGNPERILVENEIRNEPWSDTDGEDYIEAMGPTPDLETAGDKDADPMSPLVSQIVEIRQFIKKFRRSLADEETFLNSSPNTVSNNSETVEVTGKSLNSERSSPHRNCSLRERNLVYQNGRSQVKEWDVRSQDQDQDGRSQNQDGTGRSQDQDQDQDGRNQDQIGKGGLFWASPAQVKEEVKKTKSGEMMTDAGSNEDEDGKEDARSSYLILPSSPKVDLPVISPRKKKVSVTSFTTKKVSVTSPDWNNDNHHTFVHLI